MSVRFSHFVPVETPIAQSQPSFQGKARRQAPQKTVITPIRPAQDHIQLSKPAHKPNLKFGSSNPNDDVSFSDVAKTAKKWFKKTYTQAKTKVKQELDKPGSEKKVAALAGGVAFVAAEAATGFTSLGVAGTTAASAATGYVVAKQVKKHDQEKQAQQSVALQTDDENDHSH